MIPKETRGLPANVNPFCIVVDNDILDRAFQGMLPQYFSFRDDPVGTICPEQVQSEALAQEDAEELVWDLQEENVVDSLAVKIAYAYIIPNDLRNQILVARVFDKDTGECDRADCFYSEIEARDGR